MEPACPEILLVDDYSSAFPLQDLLEPRLCVHRLSEASPRSLPPAPVLRRIRALATTTNKGADATLIEALPSLELIAVAGGHLDRIDHNAASRRQIQVIGTPGVSAKDVADLAFGLIIAVARRIPEGDRFVRSGRWVNEAMGLGRRVNGGRLGIIGLGRIGREVARRAEAFDMTVAYTGPNRKPDVSFEFVRTAAELSRRSDILVVTCRSDDTTRGIVDREVLRALGSSGFLVSIARGAVDEIALVGALRAREIGGAGLDVFDAEPLVPAEFIACNNAVLLAHTGSKTVESKSAMASMVAGTLLRHFGLTSEGSNHDK